MARINLLNWREERRKQIEQQFYGLLGAGAIAAVGVVFAVQTQLNTMIDYQTSRNNYVKSEIKKVEKNLPNLKYFYFINI